MATTVQTLASVSLLIHTVLFMSLNLYLYFRSQSLSAESSDRELCEKRGAVYIGLKDDSILELVLEQHCINNTELCVYGAKGEIGLSAVKGMPGRKEIRDLNHHKAHPVYSEVKETLEFRERKGILVFVKILDTLAKRVILATRGPKGDSGSVGNKGIQGYPGTSGEKGASGTSGLPGDQGELGDTSVKGATGPKGSPGLPGDKGDVGPPVPPGKELDPKCLCKELSQIRKDFFTTFA